MFKNIYNIEKCIHLKPIIRTEEEALIVAKEVKTTIYAAKGQFNWHKIGGKYYRFKFFERFYSILNELIGPKIAQELDLKTANNYPAVMDYANDLKFYGIVSENFIDPNKEYLTMFELGFKPRTIPQFQNIRRLKKYCSSDDYQELVNDILKMTCLDYLMGQVDRVASNFLFEKDDEKIVFAPLFDYAEAYECAKLGCYFNKSENPNLKFSVGNALIAPAFWEPKFKRILRRYPQFREYLEVICSIDIVNIINQIEKEHYLNIPDDIKEYYDFRTKEKQKILF